LFGEIPDDRYQRPEVKRDVEGKAMIGPAEKPRSQSEVSGATDRQQLSQSLDDPENKRLKRGHAGALLPFKALL
jgi:hypothetical protein